MDNELSVIGTDVPGSSVRIRMAGLEELTPLYANMVSTNFDQHAFQVIFAQLLPPIVLGPEDAEEIVQRGFVEAKAVAQLVLPPSMVEQTIENLTTQLERFRQQVTETNQGESND